MSKTNFVSKAYSMLALLATAAVLNHSVAFAGPARQSSAQSQFQDAEYLMKVPNEKKPKNVEGTLVFDSAAKAVRFTSKGANQLDIQYSTITGMLYERTSKPRYAAAILLSPLFIFSKSKKHFLTLQYKGPDGQGQFALVRLHKKNFQTALATAEAQTGIKIERNEER